MVPTLARTTAAAAPSVRAQGAAAPLVTPTWTAGLPTSPPVVAAPAYAPPVLTPSPTGSVALTPPPRPSESTISPARPEPAHVPLSGPIPSGAEALAMLRSHIEGAPPASPGAGAVLDRTLGQVSELERHALAGQATPVDPAVLGTVSGARVQVEYALALLESERVELELVEALLGEVDGVRLRLKALAPSIDAGLALELKRMAGGLVERAMELSTRATQQLTAEVGRASPEAQADARSAAQASAARVLTNEVATKPPARGARRILWVSFAIALLASASYHGWRHLRRPASALPTVPGAPAHTYVINRGNYKLLKAQAGAQVDPSEVETFTRAEAAAGRTVRPLGTGIWMIEPHQSAGKPPQAKTP